MQLKLFIGPDKNVAQAEINAFQGGYPVLAVKKEFVPTGANSFWAFCVEHMEGATSSGGLPGRGPKMYYHDVLNESDFALFSKLRDCMPGLPAPVSFRGVRHNAAEFGGCFSPASATAIRMVLLALAVTLLFLAAPLEACADDLIVTNASPAFPLNTRISTRSETANSLLTEVESPVFDLDTRLLSDTDSTNSLKVQTETAAFILDTRLASDDGSAGGLRIATDSPAFTLDTRLLADNEVLGNLVVRAESPPFSVDTRLPGENPLFALLVKMAESKVFPLDTRLPQQNPLYTNLIVTAEYSPFTIDTLSGWFKAPAQTLTGGTTGGKARFAPDGLRLAKTDGARVLLWNLQSTRTNLTFTGHAAEVTTLDFSPLGDQLLTGSADGTFRWWDTGSRNELGNANLSGAGTVYAAYASDGARIFAGRGTNSALYRAPAMQLMQEFAGSEGTISAVAVCSEGMALAGNSFRSALLWDTATGALRFHFTNHTGLITATAFFPSGSNAMTASLDGTIRIWDTATGAERLRIQAGAQVGDAVLSLDGRIIASCDTANPGTANLWDAQSGALLRVFTDTSIEASQISSLALSPDQTVLATTHVDGRVCLWNTGIEPRPIHPITNLVIGAKTSVTLRSHGLYYFELDAKTVGSVVVTLEAETIGVAKLGSTSSGTRGISTDAEFANLGAAATANPRTKSLQTPPSGADVTAFRMTATKGKLPSEYDYETFSQAPVTNLHCEMPFTLTSTGKAYVLVFAPYLSVGSIQATIRAEYSEFHLSSVYPARGGNSGNVTVRIQGTGIGPDTAARLVGPGGATATSQLAMWGDTTKAWFTFALSGMPVGTYQVEISKPGAAPTVLANAFQIVNAVGPQLKSSLSVPSAVRPGRNYGMTLSYANVGDVDIAAPLFIVSSGDHHPTLYMPLSGPLLVKAQPNSSPTSTLKVPDVQILGLNQDGPPGALPPGASYEIPLYFEGDGSVWDMTFSLSVLKADATPIDWPALEVRLRPTDMAADLWSAIWSNFKSTIGSTWADYLRTLDTQAHFLALANQTTYSPGELLAAMFNQAIGVPYRRTLAAAVDAQAPTGGLPLQFSRFATDGLEHRFTVGPLGRGWSHNYEYFLTQPTSGGIVIRTPGGGARQFTLGSDGVWRGGIGDYATLSSSVDGGFVLLEKQGLSWQFAAAGQLLSIEDPNHNRITLSYTDDHLTGLTHSAGPGFTLDYDAQGRLKRLMDQAGQITDYQYDSIGEHLMRVISPGAVTNFYTYQPVTGNPSDHAITSMAFPDGTHQFFAWNSQGRVSEQFRDGGVERLQFTYDTSGSITVRDAQNAVTTLHLGTRGQLLQMTDALGRPATFNYDTNSNLTRLTGPAGDTTEMAYDAQGNASRIVNPLGQEVALTHTTLGQLGILIDARGQLTDFSYDSQGNLSSIGYTDASAEQFGYDTAGSVTNWTNRRGQNIQFARNVQGQLTRKTYPEGRTIGYQYDIRGQLTNVTDSVQGTSSLTYDARGFLTAITYPDGKGFTFEYNAAGQRSRRVGHDGYTLNYGYDAAGRLERLTEGADRELIRYTYDSVGRLVREAKGNGTFTTYAYDLAGQVLALTNRVPGGSVQSFFNYVYDAKGNRVTMTTANGLTRYDYDSLNQLTGVTYPNGRHVTYAYDAAGNRTVVSDNGTKTTYTANSLNQYTQAGDATFGYDSDGNMTRRTDSTGTIIYDYDTENRLVRVSTPTSGIFQYTYDSLGNRTIVAHNGVTNRYLHDPIGLVDVAAEYDASGSLVARYDHAMGLVARIESGGSAGFYSFDALGNTREITGNDGSVLNSYDYDAFGAGTVANETVANSFRFVGKFGVEEEACRLHFMRARSSSSDSGRYLSPDPLNVSGGDINLYNYAANQPTGLIDPLGTELVDPLIISAYLTDLHRQTTTLRDLYLGNRSIQRANHYFENRLNMAGSRDIVTALGKAAFWTTATVVWAGTKNSIIFLNENYYKPYWGVSLLPNDLGFDEPDNRNYWLSADWAEIGVGLWGVWDGFWNFNPPHIFLPETLLTNLNKVNIVVVRPRDPNDKIGPAGIGPNRVVSAQDEMEYMIRFENFATASAPVQELIVVDYLDADLDWTTARFKEMAYGGRVITPTTGSQSFIIRDTPRADSPAITGIAAAQMVVNASGSVNPQMGRVEWRLSAMDTNTSYFPLDALTGFLPPEDGTGRGQGYVKIGVRPKNNLPIGTAITNIATIVFDGNDPIDTPAVWNIIGDIPSLTASIAYLPGQITSGMPFTYTIGLTNTGTNLVENVILTNALPSGVTVVNATATRGTVTVTNGTVIWNLGSVTSGASGSLTVTALPSQEGTFANTLYYSGGSGLAIFTTPGEITVLASARLALSVRLMNATVELAWPTNSVGFRLQRTTDLGKSPVWDTITNAPTNVGEEFRLQLIRGTGTEFYRLMKP